MTAEKNKTNEKVLAMYQAVWKLIDEGRDIHRIKVSDITECAGIGKGTAYEYFRSKEEIVSRAIAYDCNQQFELLHQKIKNHHDYKKAMEDCFDWLTENRDRRRLVAQFLKKKDTFPGFPPRCETNGEVPMVFEFMKKLILLGREQGMIREEISDYLASIQIFSQFLGYFAFQEIQPDADDEEIREVKNFLCGNIIRCLQ